jgi:hypothetical protein
MRPDAWINELGPGGLDHCLKPRASARSRFGDFRAFEAEVLPAGSAQLPIISPFRVRNKQRACCPAGAVAVRPVILTFLLLALQTRGRPRGPAPCRSG